MLTDEEKKMSTVLLNPIIAVYKVTNDGKMQRSHEVEAKMGGCFNKSSNGTMVLTRSYDKKLISLCNFDPFTTKENELHQVFKIKAWHVKKLRPYDLPPALNRKINDYYEENKESFFKLESVTFVGNH